MALLLSAYTSHSVCLVRDKPSETAERSNLCERIAPTTFERETCVSNIQNSSSSVDHSHRHITGANISRSSCALGLDHKEVQATYEAYIVGREDVLSLLSPTVYRVKVVGPDGIHYVSHRYSDFADLHRRLRLQMRSLPRMPEKGMISKIEDGFLDRRQARLGKILQAILDADPEVKDSWLRRFLGICDAPILREKLETQTEVVEEEVWEIEELSETEEMVENELTWSGSADLKVECESFPAESSRAAPCRLRLSSEGYFSPRIASSLQNSPRKGEDCTRRRSCSQEMVTKKAGKRGGYDRYNASSPSASPKAVDSPDFRERHVIIARDVARAFTGETQVDKIRLRVVEVLRGYARKDPEIGYVQGMCFGAVLACLATDSLPGAQQQFAAMMRNLRDLWLPGFPMVTLGTSILKALLSKRDPDLYKHLDTLSLELSMIVPGAWISLFAKWFSLEILEELVPFLVSDGLSAFLAVTYVVILHHREALLTFESIDEALPYIQRSLFSQDPPENLLGMCRMALPMMSFEVDPSARTKCPAPGVGPCSEQFQEAIATC